MKPGAIITARKPKDWRFYVRSKSRNGWLHCHLIRPDGQPGESVWKFRTSAVEVVG